MTTQKSHNAGRRLIPETGTRFGLLTVTGFDAVASERHIETFVFVKCDCGVKKSVRSRHIKFGHTLSCGCMKKVHKGTGQPRKIPIGQKFGLLTVTALDKTKLDNQGKGRSFVIARCDCGNEISLRMSDLQYGNTASCGCMKHPSKGGSRDVPRVAGVNRPWADK